MMETNDRYITYSEAAAEAILQAMGMDKNVFLMGEGVDNIVGVYGQVLPAYKKFGPSRVIDTPLSENGLTGFAVGAALDGMRPVLIHQRNDFMLLAMDQMMNQAAVLKYVSGGHHRIPLTILSFVARRPGEGVQHSHSLQSVFAHFPGIKVGMPASPVDAKGMLLTAIFDDDPVIILEHRHPTLFDKREYVPENYYETPFKPDLIFEGSDVTIVTVSIALLDAIIAQKKLSDYGIYSEIIDLRWLRPLDTSLIVKSVKKTGRLLVVDTGWKMCSISSEIIAQVCEKAYNYFYCSPKRIAIPDVPCPASQYLEKYYHPSAEEIIETVFEMVYKKTIK